LKPQQSCNMKKKLKTHQRRKPMTELQTITPTTPLSDLVHHDAAIANWWDEPDKRSELELPGRVIASLGAAGIHTVEQLKATGPHRLRMLDGIGKLGFSQIVNLLRALDKQNGGGSHGDQPGKTTLR
jgi:hypothetical protein